MRGLSMILQSLADESMKNQWKKMAEIFVLKWYGLNDQNYIYLAHINYKYH